MLVSAPVRNWRQDSRRAGAAMELIFVLPIFLALLFGMIEFSMLLSARQQLTNAAREGARVAAMGGTDDEVRQAVSQFLGAGSLSNAEVSVAMTGLNDTQPQSGEPVQVEVTMPAASAVPDILRFVGFSVRNQRLAAKAVMRKE